jgi:hypothetical protein
MRYLLVAYVRKLNGQIDEMINLKRSLQPSDLTNSNVILDFAENKVTKCIIEGKEHPTTFKNMRDYYFKVYPQLIEQLEKEATITANQEVTLNRHQRRALAKKK